MLSELFDRVGVVQPRRSPPRGQAKERLQLVLAYDRTEMSPADLDAMCRDMADVISKYVELNTDGIEFRVDRQPDRSAIIASFPLRRANPRASAGSRPLAGSSIPLYPIRRVDDAAIARLTEFIHPSSVR